ncbi:MAG: hypothetical protein ACYTGC_19510 [Planctomycetota bacterium]
MFRFVDGKSSKNGTWIVGPWVARQPTEFMYAVISLTAWVPKLVMMPEQPAMQGHMILQPEQPEQPPQQCSASKLCPSSWADRARRRVRLSPEALDSTTP